MRQHTLYLLFAAALLVIPEAIAQNGYEAAKARTNSWSSSRYGGPGSWNSSRYGGEGSWDSSRYGGAGSWSASRYGGSGSWNSKRYGGNPYDTSDQKWGSTWNSTSAHQRTQSNLMEAALLENEWRKTHPAPMPMPMPKAASSVPKAQMTRSQQAAAKVGSNARKVFSGILLGEWRAITGQTQPAAWPASATQPLTPGVPVPRFSLLNGTFYEPGQ